jgi:hypothetical protein
MPTENAPEQPEQQDSVEDRIANILGSDTETEEPEAAASEETEEGTQPPAEETFELEMDGEKFVLPKKLEKGFMQEKDYTQKSQTLAEQRRTLDLVHEQARVAQMQQQFQGEIAGELSQLQMLDAVIKQTQSIDWASMSTDELLRKRLDLDALKDQRQTLLESLEGKRTEWTQKQQGEFAKIKAQSLDAIKKRIPGWSESLAKSIREHALNDGYTEAELSSIVDPRHAVTLWKAHQFDQLQAKAQKTVQDVKGVKTTPSNQMPQQVKDKLNYRKAIAKVPRGTQDHQRIVQDRIAKIFG